MRNWFVVSSLLALLWNGQASSVSPDALPPGPAPKPSVGLYTLLADDTDARYKSSVDWQPSLHSYQQNGFSWFYLTFIRPDTMLVPPAFANLTRSRGSKAPGAVPQGTKIIFAIGGIEYSKTINPWPWLTSVEAARAMARQVAGWAAAYGCDGIDLDIEEGAGEASDAGKNLIEFVRELKRLNPEFLVTLPVYGYPSIAATNQLVNAAFGPAGQDYGLIDSVGIMVYDGVQALEYVGNYAKIPGKTRWEGFPITADVTRSKIVLGLKGAVDDASIRALTSGVKTLGYGGIMAWYGSVLENNQVALQYARDWDSSLYLSSQWQFSRYELER